MLPKVTYIYFSSFSENGKKKLWAMGSLIFNNKLPKKKTPLGGSAAD